MSILPVINSEKTDKKIIVINGEIKTIMNNSMEVIYTNYNYDLTNTHSKDIFYKSNIIDNKELEDLKNYVNILGEKTSYIINGVSSKTENIKGGDSGDYKPLKILSYAVIIAIIIVIILMIIFIVYVGYQFKNANLNFS